MSQIKEVLWFSRHDMTEDQLWDLKRIFGGKLNITQIKKTIQEAAEIRENIEAADIIAVVAPVRIQTEIFKLAGHRPVLVCSSHRLFTPQGDKEDFQFDSWMRIKKMDIEMERL